MNGLAKSATAATALSAAAFAYAAGYEVRAYRLREVDIACLPAGREPIRVLHLSDIHLMPGQRKKQAWLRGLADLEPDLVINTGDNISSAQAIPVLLDTFRDLFAVPGVFVLGSNDYWAPVLKSPLRYFLPGGGPRLDTAPALPWRDLRDGFVEAGWVDLTNTRHDVKVGSAVVSFAGVDDPHLEYDDLPAIAGQADRRADLRLGVTHAPYLRVLNAFTRDGYDAIFAGHTHGGQVRVPGVGALVTNCDLERRRSRGLSTHRVADRESWLHVSAGCGTSPYAPYRFCCYPEATLATLIPASRSTTGVRRQQWPERR